jgi:hypothetical protein
MLIRCLGAAALIGICVGVLAAMGAGPAGDPFAMLSRFGAYAMILAAIFGGVFVALAVSAGADHIHDREERRRSR